MQELPALAADPIFWPEGEKDVDTVVKAGALALTFGGTSDLPHGCEEFVRDRDVIVLGRSPNCDLNLVATEVAPIHCLLIRCPGGGWRARHFGGRITNEPLF